jgi:hypothetical protein
MKNTKKKGIKAGIICFSVFMAPWLFAIILALVTDPAGFRGETIAGIIIGILVFAFVSAFLGYSIAKKSRILIILSSLAVVAVPIAWWYMPWIP